MLAAFLTLIFMTGGSSRVDVQSLVVLNPASILMCGMALITVKREHLAARGWLLGSFVAVTMLALVHVIPMPPALWQMSPGRQELATVEMETGLRDVWRPLTLSPVSGWQAVAVLSAPLAVLLLAIQLNRNDSHRVLMLLIALGCFSGLLGLLQSIGSTDGSLYFYRITNDDSAVGLFANRNHAAVLLACLFPMLAVYASTGTRTMDKQSGRQLTAVAVSIVLVPLILVTGSRSGLFAALLGMGSALLLYRRSGTGRQVGRGLGWMQIGPVPILGGLVVICLGFLTLLFSRATAIERFFLQPEVDDKRARFWELSIDMFGKYFPWGSGSGSFADAYRVIEPDAVLDSTYLNRAHNDWIETAATMGAPALMLLGIAVLFYLRRSFVIWRRMDGKRHSVTFARLGGIVILILGAASLTDYPLRTPVMMCVFVLMVHWFVEPGLQSPPPPGNADRVVPT